VHAGEQLFGVVTKDVGGVGATAEVEVRVAR
jgi:hypothetical protein